jgi:hypothetical protein
MRPLLLSLATCILLLGAVGAQNAGEGGSMPQLPVGQTFKQFEFPIYQDGKLKATLDATEAKGITLNRAETTDLKIQVYDNGAVTTTVTSPKADLYVNEQKMRTRNTVQIVRADMEATSQDCDFDLKTKKYLLRTHVKVVLKHFDLSSNPANGVAPMPASAQAPTGTSPAPGPVSPHPAQTSEALPDSPDSTADTHSTPASPSTTESK